MKKFFVLLILFGLFAVVTPDYGFAHSGDTFISTVGTPVIDGVQGPGEWDSAAQIPVFSALLPGGTIFIMNDATNLYFALSIPDATLGADDALRIRFDNDHNDIVENGEDNLALRGDSVFTDAHFSGSSSSWGFQDNQEEGTGAAGQAAGVNFFEIAHPLNSGDPFDISVVSGDTLGFCVTYLFDGTIYPADSVFPALCIGGYPNQSLYADLAITIPDAVGGSTSFLVNSNSGLSTGAIAAFAVGTAGAYLLLAVGAWYARRRWLERRSSFSE